MTGCRSYLRVRRLHRFPDEPADIRGELDEERWETRKLEFFRNGHVGYASAITNEIGIQAFEEVGGTGISEVATPALSEIAADPQFEPEEVSQAAFEERWKARYTRRQAALALEAFNRSGKGRHQAGCLTPGLARSSRPRRC